MRKAFTVIEILLVITLFAIAMSMSVLYSQTSQLSADLYAQTSTFVSHLRLAQSNASSGKEGLSHGVHVEADGYTIFKGDTYLESDPQNTTINLPNTLNLQNISLNGAGDDVIFTAPFGETNTYGTIDIQSTQMDKTLQVTINQFGTVQY